MAITESHPGIKVEIICKGQALEEYEDEETKGSQTSVTKYVEAQSGSEFSVNITCTKPLPTESVAFKLYLDGQRIRLKTAQNRQFRAGRHHLQLSDKWSWVGSDRVVQKFCFSKLAVSDSSSCSNDEKLVNTLKGIGEITIKAFAITDVVEYEIPASQSKKRRRASQGITLPGTNVGDIPEKALKGRALSHSTSLTPAKRSPDRHNAVIRKYDIVWSNDKADRKPFATFNFRYLSKDALKALLIIPRSPSPGALEHRDIDSLTPNEMRELLRRHKNKPEAPHASKFENIKKEVNHDGSRIPAVCIEDSDNVTVSLTKRQKFTVTVDKGGVETIDLT